MKRDTLKRILREDESFLSFLSHEARSEEYKRMKRQASKESHPATDMLSGYVLEKLDSEERCRVREHISYCGTCVGKVLALRMADGG